MIDETQKLIEEIKEYYCVSDLSELTEQEWADINGKTIGIDAWEGKLTYDFIDRYKDKLTNREFYTIVNNNESFQKELRNKIKTFNANPEKFNALIKNYEDELQIRENPDTDLNGNDIYYIMELSGMFWFYAHNLNINSIKDILKYNILNNTEEYVMLDIPKIQRKVLNILSDPAMWKNYIEEKKTEYEEKKLKPEVINKLIKHDILSILEKINSINKEKVPEKFYFEIQKLDKNIIKNFLDKKSKVPAKDI